MSLEGTIVETPLHRLATHAWKAIAGVGAVSIIVGLIALIWPGPTTVVIGVLFGVFLLLSGLMGLFVGLAVPMPGFVRAASLLVSALSVVLGLLCFRSETHSVTLLGLWIGIGWIMNSMTMLALGLSTKGQGRGWIIVSSVIGILAGIVLVASPISSMATLVWIAGVFLLVTGIVEIIRAMQLRRRARSL